MPVYEYECGKCGHGFEREQRMSDPAIKTCPVCKSRRVRKLISRSSFVLKGGGWYADGYADSRKSAGAEKSDGASAEGSGAGSAASTAAKTADSASATESKKAEPAAETKPASAVASSKAAPASAAKGPKPGRTGKKKSAA